MDLFAGFFEAPIAATLFVITILTSLMAFQDPNRRFQFMYTPYRVVHQGEWHRLLTHGLVHADAMHLIFNMIVFLFFAFPLEASQGYVSLGHWQFLVFYLLALLISAIPAMVQHRNNDTYFSLGASGAVSAVVLGMVILNPEMKLSLLFIPIWIPGWIFGLLYIAYSFWASLRQRGRIAHDAHLWGALAGIVLTVIMKPMAATAFLNWLRMQ